MMKKILISLVMLIFISSLGAAIYYQNDPSTVSYELKEGWNVVPSLPTAANYTNTCGEESPFNTSQSKLIPYAWMYSPTIHKWAGIILDGTGTWLGNENQQVVNQMQNVDSQVPFYYTEFRTQFAYSTKNCELPLDLSSHNGWTDESLEQRNMQFAAGWNFVLFLPQMGDKKFSDVFSECRVDKMTEWNPSIQSWNPIISDTENIFETVAWRNELIGPQRRGEVQLMHFKEQCTLKMSDFSSVPAPPTSPPVLPS